MFQIANYFLNILKCWNIQDIKKWVALKELTEDEYLELTGERYEPEPNSF